MIEIMSEMTKGFTDDDWRHILESPRQAAAPTPPALAGSRPTAR